MFWVSCLFTNSKHTVNEMLFYAGQVYNCGVLQKYELTNRQWRGEKKRDNFKYSRILRSVSVSVSVSYSYIFSHWKIFELIIYSPLILCTARPRSLFSLSVCEHHFFLFWLGFKEDFQFICGLCIWQHKLFNCLFGINHFSRAQIAHKIWTKRLDFSVFIRSVLRHRKSIHAHCIAYTYHSYRTRSISLAS